MAEAVRDPGSRALLGQLLGYTMLAQSQRHPGTLRRALNTFWRGLGVQVASGGVCREGAPPARAANKTDPEAQAGPTGLRAWTAGSGDLRAAQLEGTPGDQQALLMDIVMTLKALDALEEALGIARQERAGSSYKPGADLPCWSCVKPEAPSAHLQALSDHTARRLPVFACSP